MWLVIVSDRLQQIAGPVTSSELLAEFANECEWEALKMKRRDFFKLMGVFSGSAAASCGLKEANEKLIPYLVPPEEDLIPGEPTYVRSTCTECPQGCGTLVKLLEDRPVKLEGNPEHPINQGRLCIRGQAALERLYHPERLRAPMRRESNGAFVPWGWNQAFARIQKELAQAKAKGKKSVYLSGQTTGTLHELLDQFCQAKQIERFGGVELYHNNAIRKANQWVFGKAVIPGIDLRQTDFLLTLGLDFLGTDFNPVEFGRKFAIAREGHLRWHHAEPHVSLTGLRADERHCLIPGSEAFLLAYLLGKSKGFNSLDQEIRKLIPQVARARVLAVSGLSEISLNRIEEEFTRAQAPLVLVGGVSTRYVNGFETALLAALIQRSVAAHEPPGALDFGSARVNGDLADLSLIDKLVRGLEQQEIGVLFLSRVAGLEVLPALRDNLGKADFTVALCDVPDGLSRRCDALLALSHTLESWGDQQTHMGLHSVIQPAIRPLYSTRSEGDVLLALMGNTQSYQQFLATRWRSFDAAWIERGFHQIRKHHPADIPETAATQEVLAAGNAGQAESDQASQPRSIAGRQPIVLAEVVQGGLLVVPSLRAYDGRSQSLQLLQEIPDPLSNVTYGDCLALADESKLEDGRLIHLQSDLGDLRLPKRGVVGLPQGLAMVHQHAARDLALQVNPRTFELNPLVLASVTATPDRLKLPIVAGSRAEARKRSILPKTEAHHPAHKRYSLLPDAKHETYRWAMAIDLDKCTGCSACVAACYLENNVPVVGKQEHLVGREMSWIRVQPYQDKDRTLVFVPMMCQQCDYAPCETVCPVYATYHNPEGLNAQIYNRCVGTRYCANNCPYKARRFNWLDHPRPAPLDQMHNPDVSVRPTGVMEKCTFCFQRIRYAKDRAKDLGRLVRDGEVTPACAQTCPTGAISFGSMLDQKSRVFVMAHRSESYRVLEELGTQPNVYYLKDEQRHG